MWGEHFRAFQRRQRGAGAGLGPAEPAGMRLVPFAVLLGGLTGSCAGVAPTPQVLTSATDKGSLCAMRRGQPAPGCVRLEGPSLGALPLSVSPGASQVEFLEWPARDAAGEQLIGFRLNSTAKVAWLAELGRSAWAGNDAEFVHTRGLFSGAPLTALTVCADDDFVETQAATSIDCDAP